MNTGFHFWRGSRCSSSKCLFLHIWCSNVSLPKYSSIMITAHCNGKWHVVVCVSILSYHQTNETCCCRKQRSTAYLGSHFLLPSKLNLVPHSICTTAQKVWPYRSSSHPSESHTCCAPQAVNQLSYTRHSSASAVKRHHRSA